MRSILSQTETGRVLLRSAQNKKLTPQEREWVIKTIVEQAISTDVQLKIQDYPLLLNEIIYLFPSEEPMKVRLSGFYLYLIILFFYLTLVFVLNETWLIYCLYLFLCFGIYIGLLFHCTAKKRQSKWKIIH